MPVHLHSEVELKQERAAFRRHPRSLFTVPIAVHHLCEGGVRTSRGISLDLGEGGLGAIVQASMQVGDTVAIDLQMGKQLLTTVAVVRHTSSVRSGFEFVGLTPEERLQITNLMGRA